MRNRYTWHKWFAWYPVIVEDRDTRELVWFSTVSRCRIDTFGESHWEYRFA